MYESMMSLIGLDCRLSSRDSKAKGSFPRAMSEARPAACSAGRSPIRDATASKGNG